MYLSKKARRTRRRRLLRPRRLLPSAWALVEGDGEVFGVRWERIDTEGEAKMSWVPFTPGGSMLTNLAAPTKKEAIRRLMIEAAHMSYGTWENFERRGYEIVNMPEIEPEKYP
jgi:hypothetical protein